MKPTLLSICCTLLVCGQAFAQESHVYDTQGATQVIVHAKQHAAQKAEIPSEVELLLSLEPKEQTPDAKRQPVRTFGTLPLNEREHSLKNVTLVSGSFTHPELKFDNDSLERFGQANTGGRQLMISAWKFYSRGLVLPASRLKTIRQKRLTLSGEAP